MPDLDTGHLFLTYLIPILPGGPDLSPEEVARGNHVVSYEQNVRIALGMLPTAHQSPATVDFPLNSPFARNIRNHFVRMFVLEDVVYNGRNGQNALISAIRGVDTINPLPVDRLNCRYLVFTADIDAITADGAPLPATLDAKGQETVRRAYAELLWSTMAPELTEIFRNCVDFRGEHSGRPVATAADFAGYLDRCHVETTMPFHDYYLALPAFNTLALKPLIWAVAVPGAIGLAALLARILGLIAPWGINTLLVAVLGLALAVLAVLFGIRTALATGAKPLPPAQYDDLQAVLKALYVQQAFTRFAVAHQGETPEAIHAAFGRFLTEHAPDDRTAPTQAPGVIRAPLSAATSAA